MRRLAIATVLAALTIPAVHAEAQRGPDRTHAQDPYGRYDYYDRDRGRYDRGFYDRGVVYPRDRYERFDRSPWARDHRVRWIPIAQRIPAAAGQINLDLGRGPTRFRAIRIEAERGSPAIRGLYIQYRDGRYQWVALGTQLRRGGGEVIDLRGARRPIDRIIIYGDPRSRGTYRVLAG